MGYATRFPVFKAGPRVCLGQRMAMVEAATLLSMLLQRFTFRLAPGQEPWYSPMVRGSRAREAGEAGILRNLSGLSKVDLWV